MGLFDWGTSDNKSRGDGILREIIVLALPALIAQAVDPVAQLMETAFIGRIGTSKESLHVII